MPDNGFGAQNNSADTLLRIYAVTPGTLRFVVNLAPDENRTSPLPLADIEALVVDEAIAVGDPGFRARCFRRIAELRSGGSTSGAMINASRTPRPRNL